MGILYGNYEILEELPSWTSGVVYRAKNRNTGDIAAIKIMDMSTVQESDREAFYEKASQSIPLDHHNIARILDVCKRVDISLLNTEERQIESAYVVQEFVQGISLNKVIKKQGPFLPQLGFYLLQQVAEAMIYAYSKGVPHRNLTMSNIILMRDGSIKLADHGIGRLFSTGTIYYMAPEDLSGQGMTEQSEIFTAGIILFEILLGKQPFQGDDFATLMNKIAGGSYDQPLMDTIPEFMRSVIIKCLQKNPSDRYGSFQDLLEDVILIQGAQELYAFGAPIDSEVSAEPVEDEGADDDEKKEQKKPDEPVDEKPVSQAPTSLVEKLKAALAAKETQRQTETEAEPEDSREKEGSAADEEIEKEPFDGKTSSLTEETAPAEQEQAEEESEELLKPKEALDAAEEAEDSKGTESREQEDSGDEEIPDADSGQETDETTVSDETEIADQQSEDDRKKTHPLTQEMKRMIPGYVEPADKDEEEAEESEPQDEPGVSDSSAGEQEEDSDFSGLIAQDLDEMEKDDFPSTAEFLRKKTETDLEIEAAEIGGFSEEALPGPAEPAENASLQKIEDPFLLMLADVPMFHELDAEYLLKFRNVIKTRNFTDSHRIIEYGQPGDYLYILLDGKVSVLQEDADGNEIELTELGEGDCFGEMSLLTGDPCSATIRSKGPTTLLSLNKDDFQIMLAENAKISAHFNKILIQRLRKTNLKFENEIEKGMIGKLEMISLTELIQTIMLGQKTGKLLVTRKSDEAEIYFVTGNARYCKHGNLEGERAFYGLLEWVEGTFKFAQGTDTTTVDNIEIDTNGLLMEGSRRMDESSRLIQYIGSLSRVFFIEGEILSNLSMLEISEDAIRVAALFNGKRTVSQIIDENDDFELESLEAIIELFTKDLLTDVSESN